MKLARNKLKTLIREAIKINLVESHNWAWIDKDAHDATSRQEIHFTNGINSYTQGGKKTVNLVWSNSVFDTRALSRNFPYYFDNLNEDAIIKNIVHAEWLGYKSKMTDVRLTMNDGAKINISLKGWNTGNIGGGGHYNAQRLGDSYEKLISELDSVPGPYYYYIDLTDQEAIDIITGDASSQLDGPIHFVVSGQMDLFFDQCSIDDNSCTIRVRNATLYTPKDLVSKYSGDWIMIGRKRTNRSRKQLSFYPMKEWKKKNIKDPLVRAVPLTREESIARIKAKDENTRKYALSPKIPSIDSENIDKLSLIYAKLIKYFRSINSRFENLIEFPNGWNVIANLIIQGILVIPDNIITEEDKSIINNFMQINEEDLSTIENNSKIHQIN